MQQLLQDTLHIAPLTGLAVLSMIIVLVNAFMKKPGPAEFAISLLGYIVVGILSITTFAETGIAFNGMIAYGGFASFVSLLFSVSAILTLGLSKDYVERIGAGQGEYYTTIVFAVMGMVAFATATDLIVTFVGLELMSLSLYTLAGFTRKNIRGNEAALKYFLLGAFASGFFLYGIALMYGASGTTNIIAMADQFATLQTMPLFLIGLGMLVIGFAFKIGAVPFHMWVPDVYEGSPTSITAFMSTGVKAAGFGAILMVLTATLNISGTSIADVIAVLATASMVVGNLIAISQKNVKRMLAYSSVAHAGYMLIGIAAGSMDSISAVLFYLTSYTLTNVGAFGIITMLEDELQTPVTVQDFNGLGAKRPGISVLMAIFMFSLVGIPPLSGFFGKYYIFVAAIENGYTWLTIIGVITSMISVYYYLRVVMAMYFNEAGEEKPFFTSPTTIATLVVSAAGIFALGFGPQMLLQWLGMLFQ